MTPLRLLAFLALLLASLAAAACADTYTEGGSENPDVIFGHHDWAQYFEDAQKRFAPVPLECPDDCANGAPCTETPDGKQCALPCPDDTCPGDLTCTLLPEGPFCLTAMSRLCMPCRQDAQCLGAESGTEYRCADFGQEGSYCTAHCSSLFPCPDGYECVKKGSSTTECFPKGGVCECTPLAATLEASTDCFKHNSAGTCDGMVACTLYGKLDCTAAVPTTEACNGKDDNCNGEVDEGFQDENGNGIADCFENGSPDQDSDQDGDPDSTDCAPLDPAVGHLADEACNGKDDDCNGKTDEEFDDFDQDGLADCADPDDDNDGTPDAQDCAPLDPGSTTGTEETCNGLDDDCDGMTDEDMEDADADGQPDCTDPDDDNDGTPDEQDCRPFDPGAHPGALEVCNGWDDNCDGQTDEEGAGSCQTFFADADGDSFGSDSKCLCGPAAPFTAAQGGDCDDGNPGVHPGGSETCNGKDDNCDGQTDPPGTCETPHKVCIDPGDGGSEPGAVGIVMEKDVNLAIGLKTRDWLNADSANSGGGGKWTVLMTREADVYVSLASRVDYANSNGAERYVSIHDNSCGGCGGHGTETWIKPGASGEANGLAGAVQGRLVAELGLKDRGVKTGEYFVLLNTAMPACLTLPGFVDNQGDVNVIGSGGGQNNAGRAIMHGLQIHFGFGEFTP